MEAAETQRKKLSLNRETVRNLNDPILTTQGWSLWTCDDSIETTPQAAQGEPAK